MNIALIGYGAMGKRIHALAKDRGHDVVAIIDPTDSEATAHHIDSNTLAGAEVAIEFTHPHSAVQNIEALLSAKTSVVVGTTGWYDALEPIKTKVLAAEVGFLWSSNFSIGVQAYLRILEAAARVMDHLEDYDLWANELHHRNKADSPSGTAKSIEQILLAHLRRKTTVVEEKLDRRLEPHEFHFSSTRGGMNHFMHTVGFSSANDNLTFTHSATNRDGYALGALRAAEWLRGRRGFFGMNDFLSF